MKFLMKTLFVACFLAVLMARAQQPSVIPYPASIESRKGTFQLSPASRIYYQEGFKNEAEVLQQILLDEHHLKLTTALQPGNTAEKGSIALLRSPGLMHTLGGEGYVLEVDPENIIIMSAQSAGTFYGTQSLRQLLQRNGGSQIVTVPCLTISDKPRFGWRGFMLDEARYFKGEREVKRLLDQMALLKMNVFHWHLTDDTGWRIEIKKYPRLTEIGGTRKESEQGTWLSDKMDGKVHSGFYTQDQIREIIRYAEARHITIIPEIEMPGHASAAIASYSWLGVENQAIEVPTKFRIQLNVFNVANPEVIQFLHDVLDEVMQLFPSNIVHIGGDEVKYDHWKKSSVVNQYMRENGLQTPADLQISFTNGISNYLAEKKHRMMGWNEIMGGQHANNDSLDAKVRQKLSQDVIVHFWTGDPGTVNKAAERGYDVVNSSAEYTYLDYDYATTSLEKAYSFDPIPKTLPATLHAKVLGLGCQMWGEWIPTVESMNEKVYPRIAAFAETGWSKPEDKDFTRFTKALTPYLKKHWKLKGIVLLGEFK